jgi:N-methylhydantoinase A
MSWIREDQGFEGEVLMVPSADMRYRGQSYEIDTRLEASWIESGSIDLMAKAFHELHEKIYEHSDTEAEVQIINLRMVISGKPPKPNFPSLEKPKKNLKACEHIQVYADRSLTEAGVFLRSDLGPGHEIDGPAVVLQQDCTTCILQGYNATVDEFGNLFIQRKDNL